METSQEPLFPPLTPSPSVARKPIQTYAKPLFILFFSSFFPFLLAFFICLIPLFRFVLPSFPSISSYSYFPLYYHSPSSPPPPNSSSPSLAFYVTFILIVFCLILRLFPSTSIDKQPSLHSSMYFLCLSFPFCLNSVAIFVAFPFISSFISVYSASLSFLSLLYLTSFCVCFPLPSTGPGKQPISLF